MTIWFQAHGAFEGTVQTENFWGRLAGAGWAVWFYLWKAVWPLHLNVIYPRWSVDPAKLWSWIPLLSLLLVMAALWHAGRASASRMVGTTSTSSPSSAPRSVLFSLFCFIALLFPVLGFFDMYYLAISRVADHFLYLPLTALVALFGAALARTAGDDTRTPRSTRTVSVLAISVLLVASLSVLSTHRAGIFASGERLWRDTLA